ncbi:MAG: hypothetical protein R3Y47_12170 [Lachnospiraceae bacterium]
MLKKLISMTLVAVMTLSMGSTVFAMENEESYLKFSFEDIQGVSQQINSDTTPVDSTSDYNAILSNLNIEISGNKAILSAQLEEKDMEFEVLFYQSELGYNSSNSMFGLSSEESSGFRLTKFTIENDAHSFNLMAPNADMAGDKVITLGFYNSENENTSYFQFTANELVLPEVTITDEDMFDYELANFSAELYEEVIQDIYSLDMQVSSEFTTEGYSNDLNSATLLNDIASEEDYFSDSKEHKYFDYLLEESQNGPISLQTNARSLIDDIPDYLYESDTYKWTTKAGAYTQETTNVSRSIGYAIYHMPDTFTGNVLNYVMRFEAFSNINFSSQSFIHTYEVTHNVWIQYNEYQDSIYVFDDRAWNARIEAEANTYVESNNNDGYFTHFVSSSISHGSIMTNILRAIIAWVPKLSEAVTSIEEITSGTKITTGSQHPTDKYALKVEAVMDHIKYPDDHVTIQGIGTQINSVNYGYSFTVSTTN